MPYNPQPLPRSPYKFHQGALLGPLRHRPIPDREHRRKSYQKIILITLRAFSLLNRLNRPNSTLPIIIFLNRFLLFFARSKHFQREHVDKRTTFYVNFKLPLITPGNPPWLLADEANTPFTCSTDRERNSLVFYAKGFGNDEGFQITP